MGLLVAARVMGDFVGDLDGLGVLGGGVGGGGDGVGASVTSNKSSKT